MTASASTDVERLGRLLALPRGVWSARWVAVTLGDPASAFALGPTDRRLAALVRFAADPGLPVAADQRPQSLPRDIAAAVLGEDAVASLPQLGADVMIAGPFVDAAALELMPYRVKWAAETANGLLVHALTY